VANLSLSVSKLKLSVPQLLTHDAAAMDSREDIVVVVVVVVVVLFVFQSLPAVLRNVV